MSNSASTSATTSASTSASQRRATRELAGGTVIWLFVAIELLTFGLFFVAFAAARRSDPLAFTEGQAQLHPLLGAINTCVLLTGGWLVARGALANRRDEARAPSPHTSDGFHFEIRRRRSLR